MPIPTDLSSVKVFIEEEGEKLYSLALESSKSPILELGSYCGKSTIYIGSAVKDNNSLLYGSPITTAAQEHQVGEEYRPDLYDAATGAVDSLPALSNLRRFELEDSVCLLDQARWLGNFGI